MKKIHQLFLLLAAFAIGIVVAYANDQAALQICVAKALAAHPGQILSSEIRSNGSRKYCVIKVLSLGRVYSLEYSL